MGSIEIASTILSRAEQRVEIAAQNLANMTTPGYKARRPFSDLIAGAADGVAQASTQSSKGEMSLDVSNGKLQNTGNPYDLAISGSGFFAVRSGSAIYYTRNGQFHTDADGALVTVNGMVLQSDGGDVTVGATRRDGVSSGSDDFKVLSDGTVLEAGQPIARLTICVFADPSALKPVGDSAFSAQGSDAQDVSNPQIRQGMLETSNVSTADEMISMMAALRSATTGQHLMQVYDDLMGRALSAFGQT